MRLRTPQCLASGTMYTTVAQIGSASSSPSFCVVETKFAQAGVLYMCAVGSGPVHTGLRPEKQWHYLLSTSGLPQGPSPY